MKVSEYLESKRALLTRGHEYDCCCKVCMEFSEAVYNAKADEVTVEVTRDKRKELEAKAAKWDDPQTQADLELGRQVRGLIERLDVCSDFELVKWFREQKEQGDEPPRVIKAENLDDEFTQVIDVQDIKKGAVVKFLGINGHDWQLEAAKRRFSVGQELIISDFEIGGWCSYLEFEGIEGEFNSVMFGKV